jgi:pyruvate formate lyase activating enzyme
MIKNEGRPLIFDIKHFALDDGPGIRTTVFLKGCPLACQWCHNPESIDSNCEIAFYPHLCINCGDCQKACSEDAICLESADRIDREKCTRCKNCADGCPTTALKSIGKYYSVAELVEILKSDHIFYETSNGGVTFSGGEPTLYMDYVGEVMKELKNDNIHIAIQTSGMFDMSEFKAKLLHYVDLIFYDIKFIDPVQHKKYTNRSNSQILNNFLELVRNPNVQVIPRVPLIPEITTVTENLLDIADFLTKAGCTNYQLLPYNSGGIEKRCYTGKPITSSIINITSTIKIEEEWRKIFADHFLPYTLYKLKNSKRQFMKIE